VQANDHIDGRLIDDARDAACLSWPGRSVLSRRHLQAIRQRASQPNLVTLAGVAAALGMRVALELSPQAERRQVTKSLPDRSSADPKALASHLSQMCRPSATSVG